MKNSTSLLNWILKVTVGTLASICISVVLVLLVGMFDDRVDNKEIFSIIGPAFNTVIGAFVGLLGGLSINRSLPTSKDDLDSN